MTRMHCCLENTGVSQIFAVNELLTIGGEIAAPNVMELPKILNAIADKPRRQSNDDFKGRHFEARLIVQAATWYLRYPLSYRDLEEMFRERGFEVDHSFARQVANRVIFMDQGQIVEQNDPASFFDNLQHERTRLFLKQILH